MKNVKLIFTCQLCNDSYKMGPGIYDGKQIPRYSLGVCKTCYAGNWDGWSTEHEPKILSQLKEKNISIPERNSNGLLPRD